MLFDQQNICNVQLVENNQTIAINTLKPVVNVDNTYVCKSLCSYFKK